MKMLVVEDDPALAKIVAKAAGEAGYVVQTQADGMEALKLALVESFDVIVLDLMLPSLDGIAFCRRARAAGLAVPILVTTARDTVRDKVEGLDAGADDYIIKPFLVVELLARVRALLRRSGVQPTQTLSVGDLTLDPATRVAKRGGRSIQFSATEFTLLEYMMRNAGRVLTRSVILEHVWQYDFGGNDNVLDVYISYLRGKIAKKDEFPLIHTVRGVGFVLADRREEQAGA